MTVEDIFATMESRLRPEAVEGVTATLGYRITGDGGGEWTVCVENGTAKVIEEIADPAVTSIISAEDLIAVTLGKLDGATALTSGRLKVDGDIGLLTRSTRFFVKYTPPFGSAEEEKPREELIRLDQVLSIPQRLATGPVMGRFLNGLKEKKILANKCPRCAPAPTPSQGGLCRMRGAGDRIHRSRPRGDPRDSRHHLLCEPGSPDWGKPRGAIHLGSFPARWLQGTRDLLARGSPFRHRPGPERRPGTTRLERREVGP